MKRCDIPLHMVLDLVRTCIVLHNLCIIMKDSFDKTWIDEVENELAQKIANGEVREGSEVRGARAVIEKVRNRIQYRQNLVVEDVVDEENEAFFIIENEKDIDLFWEATNMHEVLATSLWEAKFRECNLSVYSDTDTDSDSN
jgi:hypothetical protein